MNGYRKNGLLSVPPTSRLPSAHPPPPGKRRYFAKSLIVQKEFFRNDSFHPSRQRVGCCARLNLFEENARFALLGLLLLLYLSLGALLFQYLEQENEHTEKEQHQLNLRHALEILCSNTTGNKNFTGNQNGTSCKQFLLNLLDERGNLSAAGLMYKRPKWDFGGAFYFVGTVISTIGFGMTTPRTTAGKAITMIYGFFGCSSCILFFNLFLERIVTALAYFLRHVHNFKDRYRTRKAGECAARAALSITVRRDFDDISATTDPETAPWRPSVYKVFICLLIFSGIWIVLAASTYSLMEGWSYFTSVYFCFVSFATIGFGDYVSSQQDEFSGSILLYRMGNFIFLSIGCCSIYSLFNVMSVVVRHFLNWMIKNLDCPCQRPKFMRKKRHRYLGLGLRPPPKPDSSSEDEEEGISIKRDRLVSLKEFLEQNKTSLILFQRQLVVSDLSSIQREDTVSEPTQISANSVGPLAILTKKFGED